MLNPEQSCNQARNQSPWRCALQKLWGVALLAVLAQGCSAQGRVITGERATNVSESLRYYLYYPPGFDAAADHSFGLLLFLHGGGESGQNLEVLAENGPPKMLVDGQEFPYLVLAPQNPYEKRWWNVRAVKQLLDSVVEENRVDPNRIYLTGLSRGGSACWELAVQYPDTFAAMMVVCGMTPIPYASWIDKDMPIWVFHGTEDPVIPFSESEDMVAKLRQMGYDVTFTAYEGVGHNAWDQAYLTPGLFEWFAKQSRRNR